MARPFRFRPPALGERTVDRVRLLGQLALRWERRMITIVAGPGFGKTVLLSAAVAIPQEEHPGRRDVWLSCEPGDASAQHLTAGLAHALGLGAAASSDEVLDAVWALAPAHVCFVLDDVHEIPAASEGAALLASLATDLAANGHLIIASRAAPPIPLARLAASGQLHRVTEADLLLDDDELRAFASRRGVDADSLRSTGGWPALAELTATAGADLVIDYLWEEVLTIIGPERARLLALFTAAGGGDNAVATAVAGRPTAVEEIVAGVPLVQRSDDGSAVVHALWQPALRRFADDRDLTAVRQRVIGVHRDAGRFSLAADLAAEAGAWADLLTTIVAAETSPTPVAPGEFGRWYDLLPPAWREEPAAWLATALDRKAKAPAEASSLFETAAAGFRDRGDTDGELAAISHDGVVRTWLDDGAGLFALFGRVSELAAAGSARAKALAAIGSAGWAHLQGDSPAVLAALAEVTGDIPQEWRDMAAWLASVAHRRVGDIPAARDVITGSLGDTSHGREQLEIADLRAAWLEGCVDDVYDRLVVIHRGYEDAGERVLATEVGLEAAAKAAWLGDAARARALLATTNPIPSEVPQPLNRVLETIARAALEILEGDEDGAADRLRREILDGPAALGTTPYGWYWRDRAAIAASYLLVPESRVRWVAEPLGRAHLTGLALAEAITSARAGNLAQAAVLEWPPPGVVRAHLPLPWIAEIATVTMAAGLQPGESTLDLSELRTRGLIARVTSHPHPRVAATARRLKRELPEVPTGVLEIGVIGPLMLSRDGVASDHPDLRRQRVRELLCLLVHRRRAQREELADELWPDQMDPARNLRVTLNYLQNALQPERPPRSAPFFVRSAGNWLELVRHPQLQVDAWRLQDALDEADRADAQGALAQALAAWELALRLWRGLPYADAAYSAWAEAPRARLQARFIAATVRAGELWLARGDGRRARAAATKAIEADRHSEAAYRLLARVHIAHGNTSGARATLLEAVNAVAELGARAEPATVEILTALRS